jgi:hypothetical protein
VLTVGGPATFALTHVLTGGFTKEFVSYDSDFDKDVECERILLHLLQAIGRQEFESTEFIIDVTVGRRKDTAGDEESTRNITDWRRIHKWTLTEGVRRPAIKIMPKQVSSSEHVISRHGDEKADGIDHMRSTGEASG